MAAGGDGGGSDVAGSRGDGGRWSLLGTTALVTGGTRGIGHAVVEELAGLGAWVHTCSRDEDELEQCLRRWEGMGFPLTGSVCDLSCGAQREKLMEKVASVFSGKLNIHINNAGSCITKPTVDYTSEEFSFIKSTNFESAFHLSQLAHPFLKASGMGSIGFVSSAAGVVATCVGSIYSATKAALNQLAKNLACEWAKDGIRCNSVAPWFIKTYTGRRIACERGIRTGSERSKPSSSRWGAERGILPGCLPLPAHCFVHHRADHLY